MMSLPNMVCHENHLMKFMPCNSSRHLIVSHTASPLSLASTIFCFSS